MSQTRRPRAANLTHPSAFILHPSKRGASAADPPTRESKCHQISTLKILPAQVPLATQVATNWKTDLLELAATGYTRARQRLRHAWNACRELENPPQPK